MREPTWSNRKTASQVRKTQILLKSLSLLLFAPVVLGQEQDQRIQLMRLQEAFRQAANAEATDSTKALVPKSDFNLLELMEKFTALKAAQTGTSSSAAIAYNGEKSSLEKKDKASASLELTMGTYPSQLRVTNKTQLEFSGNKFKDDLSQSRINYDFFLRSLALGSSKEWNCGAKTDPEDGHVNSWRGDVELYGFFDRLSNSYMAIDRRYEVGGGMKWEWNVFGATPKGNTQQDALKSLCQTRRDARSKLTDTDQKKLFDTLFPTSVLGDAEASNHQENSHLQFGLAISLFREFEKPAELETRYQTAAGGVILDKNGEPALFKVAPLPSSRNRMTIRPSLIIRPTERVAISGIYYYKLPLGSPRRVEGRRDYRADAQVKVSYTATGVGKKAPTFALGIEWHKDNAPPKLASPGNPLPPDAVAFSNLSAPRSHRTIDFSVGMSF
jgi:hypothetical protein